MTSGCQIRQIQINTSNREDLSSQSPGCSSRPPSQHQVPSEGEIQGRVVRDRHGSSQGRTSRQPCAHISYLFHVDFKGAERLTLWAGTRLHLLVLGLEEGSQDEGALHAVVFDHAELRQDPCAARHHSAGPDQLVQVQLPEEREMLDACGAPKAEYPPGTFLLQGATAKGLLRKSYH